MGELLGALGLAWPRLLLYPGGLSALLLAWLLDRALNRAGERSAARPPAAPDLLAAVAPLLVISLLPLPGARDFRYSLDLPTALALLEWPRLLLFARTGNNAAAGATNALLQGYGLLLLSALSLAQQSGALRVDILTRGAAADDLIGQALHLCGALGWSGALVLLLRPLDGELDAGRAPGWGLRLRALGHVLLAALPWLPFVQGSPWLAALSPLLLATLPAADARWGARFPYRRGLAWSLVLLQLGVLSVAAWAKLASRL